MYAIPLTLTTSAYTAVGVASAQFATTMIQGVQYVLNADTDLWWRADSADPTAAKAADSHFLAKGQYALVAGGGFKVAVIQDSAAGEASLSVLGAMST